MPISSQNAWKEAWFIERSPGLPTAKRSKVRCTWMSCFLPGPPSKGPTAAMAGARCSALAGGRLLPG